ncbi:membrane primary amine oxidase-like, partial [Chiloscyllium plagiosum]|uniref:membrane primary amine oxidase-like n=1 Tax=Chiloscyllium plagiosum TaxID=36176 RepID=UPI001CB88A0A
MNLKILFAILAVALVAIIALNWILIVGFAKSATCKYTKFIDVLEEMHGERFQSLVFQDLDSEELTSVVQYLRQKITVKLVNCSEALPSDNYIYMIELHLPPKSEVLKFLDKKEPQPRREARAVVVFGAQSEPNITEYVVGPLPYPTYHKDISSQKYQNLSFHARPVTGFEYKTIISRMGLEKASRVIRERTKFLDVNYGIGKYVNELVRGVDCPYGATFVDTVHFSESENPRRVKNSICIFEQNKQLPLRRHYFSWNTPPSYGGVADCVLIIRSTSTVANYDYIFDYIFHHNGVIETKVHPSGYALTTFLYEGGLLYGAKLEENVLGNIHTHFLHFKADLDVA